MSDNYVAQPEAGESYKLEDWLEVVFKDLLFDVMNTFVEYWNNHTMRVN